ncbi:VOC family protein [Jiangella rhizosphaerae]|uniref:Glyoxalase n=1 Tax=Jiangella rhizosphaerae TaxID=2293569 RepID=A0A418KLI5_9ACTN|nr:VOC family protein [Jiangella rhizosphaerae]RIQ18398.1 glyoxalase [Jiangella rhizosphaerae]
MSLQVSVVMLGVQDVDRAKKFYAEGMGAQIEQDHPGFVRLGLGDGSGLALYHWAAVANDAGVPAEGSGFRGFSLHYITETRDEVDAVIQAAEAAGATVLKPAEAAAWGGYSGTFSDPDGHLWKVATDA